LIAGNNVTHTIAIVGSGICGMCTAMALARQGHEITIFERDESPPAGNADEAFFNWNRKGAAQFRHPHAFLGLMCNLIADNYPDLLNEFYAAGARRVGFEEMLSPDLRADYRPIAGDDKLWVLMCRRATIETVMRRYVSRLKGVTIVNPCRVTGLLTEQKGTEPQTTESREHSLNVQGLTVQQSDHQTRHRFDIVIDASGRTSAFPQWFGALGYEIAEDKEDAEIIYYTRHYRLRDGETEPPRGERAGAGDLGYLKFGVFPGDNGHFAIILCVPLAEQQLRTAVRDEAQFDQICLNIPGLEPWLANDRAIATTEPFGIGDIQSLWRDFVVDRRPLVSNFFAVGDAALRTNPLYGRGCSTAILHASILAEVIEQHSDPLCRAVAFSDRTRAELRPIFDASRQEDKRGIRRAKASMENHRVETPHTFKRWLALSFGDALSAAARDQLHILRGALRSFHLLEKPGDFLKDWRVRRTVIRYMLRGRKRNAASRLQPGPDRGDMHDILGLGPST
jgi:2-polyprenyl-6-methoxyphenol hydroxylase-like FAD-dependent oxidoreductase